MSLLELIKQPNISIAVVGATDNPSKFGHTIYCDLKHKGYRVYPINPKRLTVDGDWAYINLQSLPQIPDLVNVIVPPQATLDIARECLTLGIKNIWLQPGAQSPEVVAFLEENGFKYLARSCIMVETR